MDFLLKFLTKSNTVQKEMLCACVSRGGLRPPHKSKLCAWVVSQFHMPARQLTFGSWQYLAWWLGCRPNPLAHSQELPVQCFFLLTSRKSQSRQLRRSVFGRGAWKAWVRTDSTTPQEWVKCQGTWSQSQGFWVYSKEKRLTWVCLHEHMCTSSFYVNLEKLIRESEEKVRTVKIKNKTTAK